MSRKHEKINADNLQTELKNLMLPVIDGPCEGMFAPETGGRYVLVNRIVEPASDYEPRFRETYKYEAEYSTEHGRYVATNGEIDARVMLPCRHDEALRMIRKCGV